MLNGYILVKQSLSLTGQVDLVGAKNAALPIMASLLLTSGKSVLENVPDSLDIRQMIQLLTDLGVEILFDSENKILNIDTSSVNKYEVKPEIMNKMRASILVTGPLLSRFGKARVAMPGGCLIGARPIDFHIKGFKKMGIVFEEDSVFLNACCSASLNYEKTDRIVLEYPSVGATENTVMFAVLKKGETKIINAALEPEVLDFIDVLIKMGANIKIQAPATICVYGVDALQPIKHSIIPDRLEAGAILLAAAVAGGEIYLPDVRIDHMDVFLEKLKEMGHNIVFKNGDKSGVYFKATKYPQAVSFKTGPYPGFPTDLQAPMMVAQCLASGSSCIEETVFENRLMHVTELQKMGAQIKLKGSSAIVNGVETLYGCEVIATDIRASCALVLAGLVAGGNTKVRGLHHWRRGYDNFENKLKILGANISIFQE